MTTGRRAVRGAALAAAATSVAALLAGLPFHATAGVSTPGPDRDVVLAAVWCAWAVAAYLLLGVVAVALSALPGAVGAAAARCSRLAPAAVRRAVELSVGAGVAVAVAAPAAPALADHPRPHPPAAVSLDWPVPHRSDSTARRSTPSASETDVIVAPGDSLWSIAARALGESPSPAQVAAAWPRWWAANRDVVGSDPDLIHPGQRLTPPAVPASTARSGRSTP